MASNEDRAKLCGWVIEVGYNDVTFHDPQTKVTTQVSLLPKYDTSLDAVAELRAFVRARGKEAEFAKQLSGFTDEPPSLFSVCFDVFIDATPAQQCAAFDATFKDELEKIQ